MSQFQDKCSVLSHTRIFTTLCYQVKKRNLCFSVFHFLKVSSLKGQIHQRARRGCAKDQEELHFIKYKEMEFSLVVARQLFQNAAAESSCCILYHHQDFYCPHTTASLRAKLHPRYVAAVSTSITVPAAAAEELRSNFHFFFSLSVLHNRKLFCVFIFLLYSISFIQSKPE